jgi:hypothetical protein
MRSGNIRVDSTGLPLSTGSITQVFRTLGFGESLVEWAVVSMMLELL